MSKTKKQHYIQQKVVDKFSDDNKVYEILLSDNRIYKSNVGDSMASKYTYEVDSLETNALEKLFNKIESLFTPKLVNIIELLSNYEKGDAKFKEIYEAVAQILHIFLVYYYRSGAVLHEIEFYGDVKNKNQKIIKLMENIFDIDYLDRLSATIIDNYKFSLIKSDNDFILSDQYLCTCSLSYKNRGANGTNRMIGLRDVMIFIPISSKYYIVFYNGEKPPYIKHNQLCTLHDAQVNEVNRIIINNSYVKAVAKKKQSIDEASKLFIRNFPAQIYYTMDNGNYGMHSLKKEVFFYENDKRMADFAQFHLHKEFYKLQKNEECLCGSEMEYGECCRYYYRGVIRRLEQKTTYEVKNLYAIERNISDYFGLAPKPEGEDMIRHVKEALGETSK